MIQMASYLSDFSDSKKMVVTETSKVHNDYEFTPSNLTLPKIVSQMAQYKNMNLSILYTWVHNVKCR